MDAKSLIYQFDDVRVDLKSFRVSKAGRPVQLEPKALEVLAFLIENRGRLIEKRELLDAVWKDAFVGENAMTRVIAQVRKALGEDSKQAKYIETVPTRGYRFIAEVEVNERVESGDASRGSSLPSTLASSSEPVAPESGSTQTTSGSGYLISPIKRHRTVAAVVVAGLIIALSGLIYFTSKTGSSDARGKAIDSIAVMPFVNVGADPDTEYLSDGISESLINSLSQLPRLTVRSRDSTFRYKGLERLAESVGRELNVKAVLTGRVVQHGDNVSISVELVDVGNNSHLWGEQYQQKLSNILQVQEDIARTITDKLRLKLTGEEQKRLAKRYTENAEAYQLYLRGRYHVDKRTGKETEKGIDYFQQAIIVDPDYALAYSGLAYAYVSLGFGGTRPKDALPKAKAAAAKALEIDNHLAEAYSELGEIRNVYDLDLPSAEQAHQRALELNPNTEIAHRLYAVLLMTEGRFDEALDQTKQALALDSLSIINNWFLGQILWKATRYDSAIEQLQKTLELDPNSVVVYGELASAYEAKGDHDQAIAAYIKQFTLAGGSPEEAAALRETYMRSGWKGYWQKQLELAKERAKRGSYVDPGEFVSLYARLGEKDKAFAWLEKAREERSLSLVFFNHDPLSYGLRSDPRFADLLRRIGLQQ